MQRVVLHIDKAMLRQHVRLGLALVRRTRDRRLHEALATVRLDDDAVLGQLLLHKDHLFRSLDDKVAARIKRALIHARKCRLALSREPALVAAEHDRQTTNRHVAPPYNLAAARVLNVHVDKSAVRNVAQAALVRRDAAVDRIRVRTLRAADRDVRVLEVELRINVRGNTLVCTNNVL